MILPILLAATASAQSAPAVSKPVVSVESLVAATFSCVAATSGKGLDIDRLVADGWKKVTVRKDGKVIDAARVYNLDGAFMMLDPNPAKDFGCTFMAPMKDNGAVKQAVTQLTSRLGGKSLGGKVNGDGTFWNAQGRMIQLVSNGKADDMLVRVAVVQIPEGKQ